MRVEGCTTTKKRRTLDSVLCYLTNHQQHVSSLEFESGTISGLYTLPRDTLQGLSRLSFSGVNLKLQPLWTGGRGVGPPLKQLCIHMCALHDSSQGKAVAAALKRLPSLEHLSFVMPTSSYVRFHSDGLEGLKQLTYLELAGVKAWGDTDIMRHVRVMTRLKDLRLDRNLANTLTANSTSGLQRLRVLKLHKVNNDKFELGVLAGKPCLQHLELTECSMLDAAGTAELMYYIEQLQELTHLNFSNSLKCGRVWVYPNPPAAAYSALTASSKLQHLDISGCTVPAGVWQKLFSPNKQLPHLRALHISGVRSGSAAAPDGSLLTSCCPGLQLLDMRDMRYSAEQLSPLAELSGLHELQLHPAGGSLSSPEGLEVVRQLTGLRRLTLWDPSEDAMLLQLTTLKHVTQLRYRAPRSGPPASPYAVWVGSFWVWEWEPDGVPVWQQVAEAQNTGSASDSGSDS